MAATFDVNLFTTQLKQAALALDGVPGIEELTGLTKALGEYASIDWSKFGAGAEAGLASFGKLAGTSESPGAFENVARALAGMGAETKENAEAFKELSKGITAFAKIEWAQVKIGLDALVSLGAAFTNAGKPLKDFAISLTLLGDSEGDIAVFGLLSEALTTFAQINWAGVKTGLKALNIFSYSINSLYDALFSLRLSIDDLAQSKDDFEALETLSSALQVFSEVAWASVAIGLKQLAMLDTLFINAASGIKAFSKSIEDLYTSSKDFNAFSLLSQALKQFSDIDWAGVSIGMEKMTSLEDVFKAAQSSFAAFREAVKDLADSSKDFGAFTELSQALENFSIIEWVDVRYGMEQIKDLSTTFGQAKVGFEAFAAAIGDLYAAEKDFAAFNSLSHSLKTFSEISWSKVTLGFAMMAILPKLIRLAANGFKAAGEAVEGLARYKESFESLESLLSALKGFSEIKWKDVFYGLITLRLMSPLFSAFGVAINKLGEAIGSRKSRQTIEAFSTFVTGLQTFGQISWGKVLFGLAIMKMFGGAFKVFAAMSGALDTSIGMLKKFSRGLGEAITELGVIAADPFFLFGMLALAGIGLILIEFGYAAKLAGEGVMLLAEAFELMAESVVKAVSQLIDLAESGPGLLKAAAGIAAISAAMVVFATASSAAGLVGAVGGVLGKITGSSPIDQILKLADASDKLDKTATALERINAAIQNMPSTAGVDLAVNSAQSAQLASQKAMLTSGGAGGGGASASVKNVSNKVSTTIVNNSFMPDRSTALVLAPAM